MRTFDVLTDIIYAIETTVDEASRRGFVRLSKDLLSLRDEVFADQQKAYKNISNVDSLQKSSPTP